VSKTRQTPCLKRRRNADSVGGTGIEGVGDMTNKAMSAAFLVLGLLGTASRAGAAEGVVVAPPVAVPVARPWVVTGEMNFYLDHQPEYATAGVGLERSVNRYLAFDASVGTGLSSTATTTTSAEVHVEPSLDLAARARAKLPLDSRAVHSLFVGVGPHYAAGGAYGDLWHGQLELGYALRAGGGFSFLYAVGTEVALNTHAAPAVPLSAVKVGDTSTIVRAGLGYSF
jgi:hypothetical protein